MSPQCPKLYIVSTPIGTLNDLSERAKEILGSVDFVICEDTRHTSKLLHHFNIKTSLKSLHLQNEKTRAHSLIEELLNSKNQCAALVSDAGTPGISDPGALFVSLAHETKIQVMSVPGPSSMTSALAACGFLQPRALFSGFLPRQAKEQRQEFSRWVAVAPCVAVYFESPKRLLSSLKNLEEFFAETKLTVCVSREISKKFEEHLVGKIAEVSKIISERDEVQGEHVVCVNIENQSKAQTQEDTFSAAIKEVLDLTSKGQQLKKACKEVAEKYSISVKELYNKAILLKGI